MTKNKKCGFTLVELLAVIVILAIILVVAVPKVMNVIEDSKKATLESTAKMIASSAEKVKVQNNLLGNTEDITCESVAKLNNQDYASCSIEFEGNTAIVTIEGSNKFEGLNVCEGTKTSAKANTVKCATLASKYITNLLKKEESLQNGLIKDDTVDQNIRYVGADPKNKVYFNCDDKYNNINYGEEKYDYASACEIWQIVGVFDVERTVEGKIITEKRIKIVRKDVLPVGMSWDSSSSDINNGAGINQWGEIKDSDGNIIYEGADLMRMLNGYYIGNSDTCRYCNGSNQGECLNDCTSRVTQLSTTSFNMVEDTLWNIGAIPDGGAILLSTMYKGERSTQTGKKCTSGNNCNDEVTRTTTWVGKIGLIYASDYAYASTDVNCASNIYGTTSTCNINNWLHPNSGNYWTIVPREHSTVSHNAWYVWTSGRVYTNYARSSIGVRPSLYLSSNVKIVGGNGDTEPYRLVI